jgi:hypothetical protein
MPDKLKTSYCKACGLFMEFPWLSKETGYLYHLNCLPELIDKNKYDYFKKEGDS